LERSLPMNESSTAVKVQSSECSTERKFHRNESSICGLFAPRNERCRGTKRPSFAIHVPTQSPTFVLGVPIVRQLLPTPKKSVCYISKNNYSASFSRFCPIWRWQPCCKLLPKLSSPHSLAHSAMIIFNSFRTCGLR